MPFLTHEPEIHAPIEECSGDGLLNRAAVGWSRHPLHVCNLRGRRLRQKHWDYWCITTETHLLSITLTNLGVIGLASVWFLDYLTNRRLEKTVVTPFGLGMRHPETVNGAPVRFAFGGLRIDLEPVGRATRIRTAFRTSDGPLEADLMADLPEGHETLSVLVPWSDRLFQYTSKHNTRPAQGVVRIGDRQARFDSDNGAFACLDFGRGYWPYRSAWNWAAASGRNQGREGRTTLGLNLGGKWTDRTGVTENGLCVDGRLHKIGEDLVWEYDRKNWSAPWRIRAPQSKRVDLTFSPFHGRDSRVQLGLFASDLHLQFGRFDGEVVTDEGEAIAVRSLLGWAEEHLARW